MLPNRCLFCNILFFIVVFFFRWNNLKINMALTCLTVSFRQAKKRSSRKKTREVYQTYSRVRLNQSIIYQFQTNHSGCNTNNNGGFFCIKSFVLTCYFCFLYFIYQPKKSIEKCQQSQSQPR